VGVQEIRWDGGTVRAGDYNLVGVQEVRWDGGTVRAGDYNFFDERGNKNHQLGKGFLYTTE
jgi:hypothetical protein